MRVLTPGMVVVVGDPSSSWARIDATWLVVRAQAWAPWDSGEDRFAVERTRAPWAGPTDEYPSAGAAVAAVVGTRWAFESAMAVLRIAHGITPGTAVQLPRRAVVELVAYFDGPRFASGRRARPTRVMPEKTRRIRLG